MFVVEGRLLVFIFLFGVVEGVDVCVGYLVF